MNSRTLTDFLFAGLAVVPCVLVAAGAVGPAIMVFVPLLIVACLCGWHEQVTDGENEASHHTDAAMPHKPGVS